MNKIFDNPIVEVAVYRYRRGGIFRKPKFTSSRDDFDAYRCALNNHIEDTLKALLHDHKWVQLKGYVLDNGGFLATELRTKNGRYNPYEAYAILMSYGIEYEM